MSNLLPHRPKSIPWLLLAFILQYDSPHKINSLNKSDGGRVGVEFLFWQLHHLVPNTLCAVMRILASDEMLGTLHTEGVGSILAYWSW